MFTILQYTTAIVSCTPTTGPRCFCPQLLPSYFHFLILLPWIAIALSDSFGFDWFHYSLIELDRSRRIQRLADGHQPLWLLHLTLWDHLVRFWQAGRDCSAARHLFLRESLCICFWVCNQQAEALGLLGCWSCDPSGSAQSTTSTVH